MKFDMNLAQLVNVSPATLQRFLSMEATALYEDDEYMSLVRSLNRNLMEETLPEVRAAYEKHLPGFVDEIKKQYQLKDNPMSAYTLGNWMVGILRYPETTNTLLNMHTRVPSQMIIDGLPHLLSFLDEVERGGAEWQRALCILSIPLMVHNK